MFDQLSSTYGQELVNGPRQVDSDTDVGQDGTTKHYINVLTNADGSSGNLRACDYIQDRHGNRTTLTYGQSITLPSGATEQLLTKVTDPSGRQLVFTWTNLNSGNPSQPAWRITQAQGPLSPSGTVVAGVTLTVQYNYYTNPNESNAANDLYNLQSVTIDPGGLARTTSYTYTGYTDTVGTENGLLSSITDPEGNTVSYTYTAYNVDQGDPNGGGVPQGTKWYYDTGTVWVTEIDESGGVDASNNPRTLKWYLMPMFSGSLVTIWNNGGFVTTVDSDSELRFLTASSEMNGYPYYLSDSYDANNNVINDYHENYVISGPSTGPGNHNAFPNPYYHYSVHDNYTYGTVGNMLTHVLGNWTQQQTSTWYNLSQYFQKASDTDFDGHTTSYTVGTDTDANTGNRGEVLAVQDPGYNDSNSPSYGKQYTYTYNQYGQKTSETNLNGVVTDYTYGDTYGNLTQVVQDPGTGHLNRTTTMTYDLAGHVLSATDPSGNTTDTTYNVVGQPTTVKVYDNTSTLKETISYTYGSDGRTQTVTDHRGTTTISYENGCDRVHSVNDPVTGTITYTYLITGQRASMTLPGSSTAITYSYSVGNGSMANQTPGSVTYYYGTGADTTWPIFIGTNGDWLFGKAGDLDSLTPALTQITDDAGRIESIYVNGGGAPVAVDYNQVYNGSGSLISYCETDYDYSVFDPIVDNSLGDGDWQGWLQETRTVWNGPDSQNNPTSKIISQNDYTYDNAGMRLSNTISVQQVNSNGDGVTTGSPAVPVWASQRTETYGYDDLSRLTSVNYGDGEQQSYSFDAMGNRTQKWDTITGTTGYTYNNANMLLTAGSNSYANDADGNTLSGGARTNTWDCGNRLTQCVDGNNTSQYDYSYNGLRTQQSVTSGGTTNTTDYGLDTDKVVREWTVTSGSLTPAATYLTGQRGTEYKRFDQSGLVDWYVYDGLGGVVAEINPSGSVQASQNYDVYGNIRSSSGTSQTTNHFAGSLGHSSDQATGLIYMRARYYDPSLGRFLSVDPGKGGDNWLIYCADNPINAFDENGKVILGIIAIALIALITALAFYIGSVIGYNLFVDTEIGDSDPSFPHKQLTFGGLLSATASATLLAVLQRGAQFGRGIGFGPLLDALGLWGAIGFMLGMAFGAIEAACDMINQEGGFGANTDFPGPTADDGPYWD